MQDVAIITPQYIRDYAREQQMIKKSSIPVSRKLLVIFLLTLLTSNPAALHADDYVHMIQYELLFGNKQAVSNLYMSMQPAGMEQSLYSAGSQAMFRTPVISTDPRKFTLLRPLSVLFATEESESADDTETDSDPDKTVGEHVGTMFYGLLVLAPIFYAIGSSASDISDIGDIDLDIPDDIVVDIPEVPAEEGS